MAFTEHQLSCGALVRLRPVPPYVLSEVHGLLPEPPFPKVTVPSPAGAEVHPALPETPEYEEYRRARDAHRKWINTAVADFALQYGITEWSWDEGEAWNSSPPKDWVGENITARWNLPRTNLNPFQDRRLEYIKQVLVLRDTDRALIDMETLGPMEAITEGEVQAAMAPFGSEMPSIDL